MLPTLQVEGSPKVFAIGDCNDVAETKLGYFASFQANSFSEPHALRTNGAALCYDRCFQAVHDTLATKCADLPP